LRLRLFANQLKSPEFLSVTFCTSGTRTPASKELAWDELHPDAKVTLLKTAAQSARNPKEAQANWDSWTKQAEAAGYRHETVLNTGPKTPGPAGEEHIEAAYQASLPLLEREMEQRSVISASVGRYAAIRGFMQTGIRGLEDIDKVTALMRSDGVRDEGHGTKLIVAKVKTASEDGIKPETEEIRLSTKRHLDQEREAIRLAEAAAGNKSGALSPAKIQAAVKAVSERDGLDFAGTEHGREQRKAIDALGQAGQFGVLVGIAGSGKTTLLRPLVEAWNADGRRVFGTAIARRQSDALVDAGIRPSNAMPVHQLLKRGGKARKGGIALDRKTVVVVDELSQIGTRQLLRLMRLQEKHGFRIVAIGDHAQNQSIEAGSSVNLLRKALAKDDVPELLSSVRQLRERDRETALLFRDGKAEEGIKRLQEDGQFKVVPGGYRQAVEAAADMWVERQKTNAERKDYSLTISAPTNAEARDISAAIRERKRAAGTLGPDRVMLNATDQRGAEYSLPLATGDRVRLFRFTHGVLSDSRTAAIGNNGSVLTVEEIRDDGLRLRTRNGGSGFVRWDALKAENGRVLLSYGDALTADAVQGATSTEHLNVMVAGSAGAHAYRTYPAQSRAREATWMIVSEGRETAEALARRPLGADRTVTPEQIRENVARNLSRQPEKELASDLVASADKIFEGGLRSLTQAERDAGRARTSAKAPDAAQQAAQRGQAVTAQSAASASA
jgi:AAA domain